MLLVLAQIGLARFSNRILNVPLVIATVLVAVLGIWVGFGLSGEQNALSAAQRKGSDAVQLLSASRVLALRAQRDDSLALIGRGSDTTSLPDFERTMIALRGERTAAACSARRSAWRDARAWPARWPACAPGSPASSAPTPAWRRTWAAATTRARCARTSTTS